MILQALNDYYERLRADPEVEVSDFGFGMQGVHFCLTIDKQGNLVGDPIDLRQDGRALRIEVPGPVERTVGVVANFAWDNTGYVLGADNKGKPERSQKTHEAFKSLVAEVLEDVDDEGARALLAFLSKWNPENAESLPKWTEMVGLNVVLRLDGNRQFLHQRSAFRNAWLNYLNSVGCEHRDMCLVTGKKNAPIPYIHIMQYLVQMPFLAAQDASCFSILRCCTDFLRNYDKTCQLLEFIGKYLHPTKNFLPAILKEGPFYDL